MRLSLLLLFPCTCLATFDVEKELSILNPNGNEGPNAVWVALVKERLQKFNLKRTGTEAKQRKISKVDMEKKISELRKVIGEKDMNKTDLTMSEHHPDLAEISLEGDMILSPEQIEELDKKASKKRQFRAATTNSKDLWSPSTAISYTIDPSLYSITSKIRDGVQFWTQNSCIRFSEGGSVTPRIRFYRGSGCWSYIGKQPWTSQDISIGYGCESPGTITHEIAHALGFFHTQSRYDRDTYLQVMFSNIQPSQVHNFNKMTISTETHFGLKYDFGSVMQYGPYAFALNSRYPTTVAIDSKFQNMMGQRNGPSFSDIKQMNLLYNCSNQCSRNISCNNNGIINPNTCSSCICPTFFQGPYCDELKQGNAAVCRQVKLEANSTSTKTYTIQIGTGKSNVWTDTVDCYFAIQAPKGRRAAINIRSINGRCVEGCGYGGLEINLGDLDMRGFLTCCSSISSQTFASTKDLILIRGTSAYNNVTAEIMYWMA